ncbi:hypothetical protein PC116_g26626, partial [Phytophthora cactorum]
MLESQRDLTLHIQVPDDHSVQHQDFTQAQQTEQNSGNVEISKETNGVQQSKPNSSPVAKILFLDGVRGTAVIFVVTQHTGYMHDIFMGAVGVDAFFVLSSFLLTMI